MLPAGAFATDVALPHTRRPGLPRESRLAGNADALISGALAWTPGAAEPGGCGTASTAARLFLRGGVTFCLALGASQRRQRANTWRRVAGSGVSGSGGSDDSVNENGQLEWFNFTPDVATQGKLRALGRLLRTVGERLVDGASAAQVSGFAYAGAGNCAVGEDALRGCGTALQGAAVALLREKWADADSLLGAVTGQCASLLPQEHLAVLQALLTKNSKGAADVCEALRALGKSLEAQAENLAAEAPRACEDALFDAAIAFRSASRLFDVSTRARAAGASASASSSSSSSSSERQGSASRFSRGAAGARQPAVVQEVEKIIAAAAPEHRKAVLRSLTRKYHPDRNPGREMEVLPAFLYIQRLREDINRWGRD